VPWRREQGIPKALDSLGSQLIAGFLETRKPDDGEAKVEAVRSGFEARCASFLAMGV
jgi:hypothetical protein